MKTFSYIMFVILSIEASYAQTIRRVNNNPGVTGLNVYSTVSAAHDAAAANDILVIEPSGTSYGDVTLTKPLKIYGNGYFLNVNTELKAERNSSTLGKVYFNTGSGGSEIYGLSAELVAVLGVSNIKIVRCYILIGYTSLFTRNITSTTETNVSNIQIIGNYLLGITNHQIASGYTVSNVLITNNIITAHLQMSNTGFQNIVVKNNTLLSTSGAINIINGIFENNLVRNTPVFSNVTYSYNISSANSFSGGIGNQNNYDVPTQFIGTGAGISDDEQYQLKPTSPLKTAGAGGTEVGAYGGTTPYVVSGIAHIPSITNMINTATGSNTTPVQVTISVKSNN